MRNLIKKKRDIWFYAASLIFLFYIVIMVYPLVRLLGESFTGQAGASFSLQYFVEFFTTPYYARALWNSLLVTVSVTVLTIVIAFPLAYFMTTIRIRGKNTLQILILISSMSPPFIGAYSWILLLGTNGVITNFAHNVLHIQIPTIYGFTGIVLVLTLQLVPLIFMYLMGAWRTIDVSLLEASESMGVSGLRRMYKITGPLILPTILSGGLLVFMRALADFGTPMLIGQGFQTVPVLIYNSFVSEVGTNDGLAAAISVVVIVVTLIIFLIQKYFASRKNFSMSALQPILPKKAHGLKNIVGHAYVYGFIALAILPMAYVVYTAFLKTKFGVFIPGYSLDSFTTAFNTSSNAILNTLVLGIVALACVVVIAVFVAYVSVRRRNALTGTLDTLTMVPYIVPGLVVGIAFLLSFNRAPLLLTGTATIMILALVMRRLPYTIRSSSAILYQISPSVEEASISLGASNLKTFFRVTIPMMGPGVISGAILTWVAFITELSATIFLYTVHTETLSISIYTEVIRGQYGVAAALSTILTVMTVVSLFIFLRINRDKEISI